MKAKLAALIGNLPKGKQIALMALMAFVLTMAPASFAQSTSINFDLQPFFDSLNDYLPVFIGLFAVIGGISGAIALARFVINAVVNAFRGGQL